MLAAISVFDADQNITLGRAAEPGADYSASSAGVNAALSGTSHGGDAEGDRLLNIGDLRGSAFADQLTGNAAANRLDGGAGIDTVSYASSSAGVTVSLATAWGQNLIRVWRFLSFCDSR